MKTTKCLLAVLLTLALLCTGVLFAFAEGVMIIDSGTCGDDLTWTLDSEGTLTITGTGKMNDYEAYYTPDTFYTNVPWGNYYQTIQTVVIGDGVTSIGYFAFTGCTALASVTIPDSVTNINFYTFSNCSSLISVMIPNSVTSIIDGAFSNCTSLASVTIPDSVTSIGEGAFRGCTSLASVTIPGSLTSIDVGVFSGCTALKSVTISDGLTSIGVGMFSGCTALESVTIPESVTSIGTSAFNGCTAISTVNYVGSEQRWYRIVYIGDGNVPLKTANIIFDYCPHVNTVETQAATSTCTSVGYTAGVFCTDCEKYVSGHETVAVLPHSFGAWKTFLPEEAGEKGVEIRFCSTCGFYELRESEATGDDVTPTDSTELTNPSNPTEPTEPTTQPSGENEQSEEAQSFFAKIAAFFRNLFDRIFGIFKR